MDLDLTVLDAEQLNELQSKVNEQTNLRIIAGQKAYKDKFLKSKDANKLAQKVADLKAEFKSLPLTSKVNISVELEIKIKPHTTALKLFLDNYGDLSLSDLFDASYSFKLLNANDFSKKAVKQLGDSIEQVLENACMEVIEFDKNLDKTLNDFIERANSAARKIDELACEFDNVEKELEKLQKEKK
jgi:hypothetical protein